MNAISPLAELEAQQFPLVQSCVLPKLVSTADDIRKASAEAERKIDAHVLMCRFIIYYFCVSVNLCTFFSFHPLSPHRKLVDQVMILNGKVENVL